MKAKKWGRIINIASAHALVASPFKSAYVAAKHGIAGLTKTVALEVAPAGHHDERHLPGLRLDAARREADPRHRQGARAHRAAGHQRRAAARAADQEVRAGRARSLRSLLSLPATPPPRSPAPSFPSTAAGRRNDAAAPTAAKTVRHSTRRTPMTTTTKRRSPATARRARMRASAARTGRCSCCRAAARSAPTRSACTRRCTRRASSPTG